MRGLWRSHTPTIVKFTPLLGTSLLKPKNDPEHVVMAPETPSTGRRVHGRQNSKRNERDIYPARDRGYGAYRNDSVSMVPLSIVNFCTRETSTRLCTKKEVTMQDRKEVTIPAVRPNNPNSLSSHISKMVMRMGRHHDQDERDLDGAVQWNTILSNGKENIRCENWTWSWRQQHDEIRVLPGFKKRVVDIRAIQGPTGGGNTQTEINRSCADSIQLKSIYLPQVLRVVKVLSHEQVVAGRK